jgi:hypothetical protein
MLVNASKLFNALFFSKIEAHISIATGVLNIPAHPQELNFLCSKWGALSVPRKNLGSPLVAAF